jgi:protein-S-isoprenylcysteine O-methyltransferase Ste14
MLNTTFSVVIRIILWVVLLIGGIIYSISKDLNNPIFQSLWYHLIFFIIGVILMRFSFKAASIGGKELSKSGRDANIPRLETNRLVTSGIYSCLRHPMLFGLTLLPLSIAFITGSPTFITIVSPLEMIFIIFMVLVFEELEVKKKFKKSYEAYKKETPIIPKNMECLKKLFDI